MTLTMSSDGAWSVTAKQIVEYAVRSVHNVLNGTFAIPKPDSGECDVLGRTPAGSPRRLVVVDREVMHRYGERILGFLDRHGIDHRLLVLPGGEAGKTMQTVFRVCREMDDFGIARRSEPVIVFSGGVLNDVVGMAASIYRRGIDRIGYGTTLVALVDATVGAKTACDHNGYKNRLGTYRPAKLVVADRAFLATQERRRLSDGMAEILKLGIVCDKGLFELLEDHGGLVLDARFQATTPEAGVAAAQIVEDAIKVMLTELHENLWEDELARATYFGHTWSPKVEMEALRRTRARRDWLLHGEAVTLDMLLSVSIACARGLISESELDRVVAVVDQLGLPVWDPLLDEPAVLAAGLEDTVRHRDGRQLVPLPESIGSVTYANDITPAEVTAAVAWMRSLRDGRRQVSRNQHEKEVSHG